MRLRFFISLILFVNSASLVIAQPSHIYFDHITTSRGLSNNVTWAFCKDKQGFVWFGTEDGLNRFDGKNFKVFRYSSRDSNSISYNSIYDLLVDFNGTIWIGTFNGLCSINPLTDQIKRHPFPKNINNSEFNPVYNIKQDPRDSVIWVATSKGLFHIDHYSNMLEEAKDIENKNKLSSQYCHSILIDNDSLWIGTTKGLITYFPKTGKHQMYFIRSGKDSLNLVNDIYKDKKGTIWLGTWGKGLHLFDPVKKTTTGFSLSNNPFEKSDQVIISEINETNIPGEEDILWVTANRGLKAFNKQKQQFISYPAEDKNDLHGISAFATFVRYDPKDGLWIGSDNGVYRYDPALQVFRSFNLEKVYPKQFCLKDILTAYADPIDPTGETILFSTWSCGNFKYNLTKNTVTTFLPGLVKNNTPQLFNAIYRDTKQNLWLGTSDDGVKVFDDQSKKIVSFYDPGDKKLAANPRKINCLLEDNQHRLWIGARNGLFLMNKETGNIIPVFQNDTSKTNQFSDDISAIIKDQNDAIWFCSVVKLNKQCVIGKISPGSLEPVLFYNKVKDSSSLPEKWILHGMCLDNNNNIWCATWDGLLYWNAREKKPVFKKLTSENGLSNERVFKVECDSSGRIWAGTLKGLSCFDPVSRIFRNYTTQHGLQKEIIYYLFKNSVNGDIIVSYDGQFDVVNPFATQKSNPPGILISEVRIFNELYHDKKKKNFFVDKGFVDLSSRQNMVSISFTSQTFTDNAQIKYAYLMQGVDKDWIVTTDDYVTYSRLPHGQRRFFVKACNADGIWSEKATWVEIDLAAPFYKTWWFISLCACMIAGILFGIYRNRIRQIEAKYRIRSTIARDLHDEIGSTLTSINILSRVSHSNLDKDKSKASGLLEKIMEQSQDIQQSMSDIIWAVKPDNDKLENMAIRMREYLSHTLESKNISIEFHTDESALKESLGMEQRRDFFLIFKEAVNNAAKYSNGSHVKVSLKKHNHHINLMIQDNGIGFDVAVIYSTNGIKNMEARAKALNGTFRIFSSAGQGTVVNLDIPVTV